MLDAVWHLLTNFCIKLIIWFYSLLESDLDQTQEKLLNANNRLEEKEKALQNAEGEVSSLNRRIQNLEEELEKTEDR